MSKRDTVERYIPAGVRRTLRQEVGFGCPVSGCGTPYLTYHHFDPPYSERPHHNPDGMIALCGKHHTMADHGVWTKEQLRALKKPTNGDVRGRLEWMRDELLAVVGGNFYHETPTIVQIGTQPVIWFRRDGDGRMLLNLRMPSTAPEPRLWMEDNDWLVRGSLNDFESPPNGKLIRARYENGDRLEVQFREFKSAKPFGNRYPVLGTEPQPLMDLGLRFPLAVVEINLAIGGISFELSARGSTFGSGNVIAEAFVSRCGVGLRFDL